MQPVVHAMYIEQLTREKHQEWDHYVTNHSHSTCYHLSAWQKIAQRAYGIDTPFLIARLGKDEAVCGVLPLFSIRGLVKRHMTTGLFGAYGQILADTDATRNALLDHAREIFESENLSYFLLKNFDDPASFHAPEFQKIDSWVVATLALLPGSDEIWRRLDAKTRNCVRKAMRFNFETRVGKEQLPDFYDVLAENMHNKGAPIYGYLFVQELANSFGNNSEVITLWKDGKAVAGALLLFHRDTVTIPFASSRPDALAMCPNNLLYWEIIRLACIRKMKTLDFGRSLIASGPLKFKQSWGAEVLPQPCYVLAADRKPLKLDPNDPFVSFFVKQWQKLPRPVVDKLGPSICRQVAGLV